MRKEIQHMFEFSMAFHAVGRAGEGMHNISTIGVHRLALEGVHLVVELAKSEATFPSLGRLHAKDQTLVKTKSLSKYVQYLPYNESC